MLPATSGMDVKSLANTNAAAAGTAVGSSYAAMMGSAAQTAAYSPQLAIDLKSQQSEIEWLLDVDDTLLVADEHGNLIFNEDFLKFLVEQGVKKVTLLTKMDARTTSFTSKVRLPLIQRLNELGIQVERVLTTVDMLQRDAAPKPWLGPVAYRMGDAYEKLMRPVETALLKAKSTGVDAKTFAACESAYAHEVMLATAKYLMDAKLLQVDTKCTDFLDKPKAKAFSDAINAHVVATHKADRGMGLKLVDFDTAQQIVHQLKSSEKAATVQAKLAVWQKSPVAWPQLKAEQRMAMDDFFSARLQYRNQDTYCFAAVQPKAERGKGDVYQQWVNERIVHPQSLAIFVDDNQREHTAVAKAHAHGKYPHKLWCSLPASNNKIFNYAIPVADFVTNFAANIYFMRAQTHATSKNFDAAIRCFELAYYYANQAKEPIVFPSLIADIVKARQGAYQKGNPRFDNSEFDVIYSRVNNSGFEFAFRKIELNMLIHQHDHASIYAANPSKKIAAPAKIDDDFDKRIVSRITWLADRFPDQSERCVQFLQQLQAKVIWPVYKDFIGKQIEQIQNPVAAKTAGSAGTKPLSAGATQFGIHATAAAPVGDPKSAQPPAPPPVAAASSSLPAATASK